MDNQHYLIINADDFGLSSSVNKAILNAFELGYISSTTIMPNGKAFEEACQLAHDFKLISKVGVHINLTEGFPLTKDILSCPRFCNDGVFQNTTFNYSCLWHPLNSIEKKALKTEVNAQIAKCREYGLSPFHADSHHHKHTEWPIAMVMIEALHEQEIRFLRLSRNVGEGISFMKYLYKKVFNYKIKYSNLGGVQYFGSIDDFLISNYLFESNMGCAFEMMCHPRFIESSNLVDIDGVELGIKLLSLREILSDIKMISYKMLNDI